MEVGAYTEKPFVRVCIMHMHANQRIIKLGGGRLHGDGRLLRRIWFIYVARFYAMLVGLSYLDESVEVEQQTQSVIATVEGILGESIQQYF